MRVLVLHYRLDREALRDALKLYSCANCATLWYDPWFRMDVVATLYRYASGVHKEGWIKFGRWVGYKPGDQDGGQQRVWDMLATLLPKMQSYGEVNCPFNGLLFHAVTQRWPRLDRSLLTQKLSILGQFYAQRSMRDAQANLHSMEMLIDSFKSEPGAGKGIETYLIEEHSDMCWGRSCTVYGANCVAVAQDTLIDRVVTFEGLRDTGTTIDAIGFFNVPDHFPDPIAVLDKALDRAMVVIADFHKYGWTDAQHAFNIGTGFADLLKRRGLAVEDVTSGVCPGPNGVEDRRYYIISRRITAEKLADSVRKCQLRDISSGQSDP
jgi:hypothetical protein